MSSYIPGAGLKKPLNQLEAPIQPGIKKGPPRFKWSRKNWKVDTGRTLAQVEHIPQIQEAAVLVQSRDYNRQHAYGSFPKYTTFVNKEFRPPLIERDDLLPLSRIPRPVIVPRINPGSAFSSGGSAFSEQNTSMPSIDKYLSDRVKEGEIRPTFFAPISMPVDNSILPDLELSLPAVSTSSGYKFPTADAENPLQNLQLQYKTQPVSAVTGMRNVTADSYNAFQDVELQYSRPQVSADSGKKFNTTGVIFDDREILEYNRPQVSSSAGKSVNAKGITQLNFEDFEYNRPEVSATSGFSGYKSSTANNGITSTDILLETKVAGTQGGIATATFRPVYDPADQQMQHSSANSLTDTKDINNYSYVVPSNTAYQSTNSVDQNLFFRQKQQAIGRQYANQTKGHYRKAGVDQPQIVMKSKRG